VRTLVTASLFAAPLVVASLFAASASAQELPLGDPSVELDLGPRRALPPPRPRHDLTGPLALVIPGAAATLGGAAMLLVAGFGSWDVFEDGPPGQELIFAGSVLVGLGVPLLIGGIYWLLDTYDRPRDAQAVRELGVLRF
jgi:hypothetical protein